MSDYSFTEGSRRLWTIVEVVKMTGYSTSTIKRAIAARELLPHRPGARRIVHSELCRWLGYDPLDELTKSRIARADDTPASPGEEPPRPSKSRSDTL